MERPNAVISGFPRISPQSMNISPVQEESHCGMVSP